MSSLETFVSCLDDYDPNALAVDKARTIVRSYVTPIAVNQKVPVRAALGRVLGTDIVSSINVPASDNSAMDGWAVRGDDLAPEGDTRLIEIGTSFAGRAFAGEVGKGKCVRVMTGAVMPAGTDTVVIQEVVRADGDAIVVPAGQVRG
ncbi:MAG: molybdopterin molybdenumtransferase MoeA, partial [Gammaproteobacteria bacterium]|nr:molybdopterin molybdenumtransferase MoeA [Gammaproteobacteria bacterium]